MEAAQDSHQDTEQLHHEVERKEEEAEMNRHERKEEDTHAPEACGDEEEKLPVVLYKTVSQKEVAQLQCPIHKGLLHDPVGTDKCKHVFCRSCLSAWVDLQGHCPLDSRPVPVEQLVPAQAVADKLNALLIHCRWGAVQDPDTGAWVAASGDGCCPALITIGDRKAHEDSCAYRPLPQTPGGAQLMNKIQFPNVNVNVDQVMQALKSNLSRFERVLAERMDVLLAQMRSLLEEQNLHRIRSGASGAMNNFKEEMEAAIAGLMAKQAPLFRSIADKSESLCSEARDAARAKGSALYEGAVHIRNQAAVASGEALSKLDGLAQEIMGEVKLALMRTLEPTPCPNPPPPPPPDRVFEENGIEDEVEEKGEEQEQEQEQEQEVDADVEVHVSCPAAVTVEDADWDDSPAWIPAQPTLQMPPRYPPPPPPRSSKLRLSL